MNRLDVNFNAFGDRTSASARLRAWYLAEELNFQGHRATVGGARRPDVEVFQKVRDFRRLGEVRRRRIFTIYDLDDNYLLEDVGTRDDVLSFVNLVDMVTVGSGLIREAVEPFHDHVHLFENPLDVSPGSRRRQTQGWRGSIGWFGNRTNLTALEGLGLRYGVTTVTGGGDIEWDVETVDDVIAGFDLVLIPVDVTEWTLSKNANRLLKAVALGVPFLASRTAEHENAVANLGLPESLLVDTPGGWNDAIDRVREKYDAFEAQVEAAGELAMERFGIRTTALRWKEVVQDERTVRDERTDLGGPSPRAPLITGASLAALESVDVVVLNENDPEFGEATLMSLSREGINFASVTLVASQKVTSEVAGGVRLMDRHDDYFDIYASFADAVAAGAGEHVLLLRAGTRLFRGWFHETSESLGALPVHVFATQSSASDGSMLPSMPTRLDALLLRPVRPEAVLVQRSVLEEVGGIDPSVASLGLWELLLRLYARDERSIQSHSAPLMLTDLRAYRRHTVQSYVVWVETERPELVGELPGPNDEWHRLRHTLHAAIVDRHEALFASRAPTVVSSLNDQLARLEHELQRREEALRDVKRRLEKAEERAATSPEPVRKPAGATDVPEGLTTLKMPALVRILRPVARAMLPSSVRTRVYRRLRSSGRIVPMASLPDAEVT